MQLNNIRVAYTGKHLENKMARPPRIELGSQASEAYVISIGPRARIRKQQQLLLYKAA